jgi:protein-S-isoprenylcysteine O-methyltransferase Ste14
MNLTTRILELRPPRIAICLVLAAGLLHYLVPSQNFALPTSTTAAGVTAISGFAVMIRAWWLFKLRGTAICPTANTTVLIIDDVFSQSRNPMYLGMLMMLLALAIYVGSLPFYFAALTLFIVLNNAFCPYEEQKLVRNFGHVFTAYQSRVRRWI